MTTGDQLWTDENSRAEVQLGSAVIRLAPDTGFSFLNLDDNTVQIQLTSGAINVTVRRLVTTRLRSRHAEPGVSRFPARTLPG